MIFTTTNLILLAAPPILAAPPVAVSPLLANPITSRGAAGSGKIVNDLTCIPQDAHQGDSARNDCAQACNGFKAGTMVGDYTSQEHNKCYVTITQSIQSSFEASIAHDACTALLSACPNGNAVSEFRGDGIANSDAGGTLRIMYDANPIPSGSKYPAVSVVTSASGEFLMKAADCVNAVQYAILPQNTQWTDAKPHNATAGTCQATYSHTHAALLDASKSSSAGQDILTIPNVCNGQGLCRTSVDATLGDGTQVALGLRYVPPVDGTATDGSQVSGGGSTPNQPTPVVQSPVAATPVSNTPVSNTPISDTPVSSPVPSPVLIPPVSQPVPGISTTDPFSITSDITSSTPNPVARDTSTTEIPTIDPAPTILPRDAPTIDTSFTIDTPFTNIAPTPSPAFTIANILPRDGPFTSDPFTIT